MEKQTNKKEATHQNSIANTILIKGKFKMHFFKVKNKTGVSLPSLPVNSLEVTAKNIGCKTVI